MRPGARTCDAARLVEALTADEAKRVQRARYILGSLAPRDEIDPKPLVEALDSHQEERVVLWAVVALGRLGRRSTAALPQIARLACKAERVSVRHAALIALASIDADAEVSRVAMLGALRDPSEHVRRQAVEALEAVSRFGEAELAAVRALAEDPDEAVREAVAMNLRNRGERTR